MMRWLDELHCEVDGWTFSLMGSDPADEPGPGATPDDRHLFLFKPRWMVERYAALCERVSDANTFELGILRGGSTAFLALLLHPRRHVAVEISPHRVEELDAFLASSGLDDSVHAHFGVDQADVSRLEEIVESEYGSAALDLVIDDASHLLGPTTASFNLLFPRIRPGGLFILEDWSTEHVMERAIRVDNALAERLASDPGQAARAPLSHLVLQLALVAAYAPEVVARVEIERGWVEVTRGDLDVDPATFDVASWTGAVGGRLLAEPAAAHPAPSRASSVGPGVPNTSIGSERRESRHRAR